MIKAVIFDLDGVIVSTDYFHYLAWKEIANQESISFDETDNHQLRGVSRKESLEIILRKSERSYTEKEKIQLLEMKNNLYIQYLQKLSKRDITDGVVDLITQLKSNGIKVAIGSSSKNARRILNQIDLFEEFDAIVDGNDIVESKPNPEVFLKAAAKMKVLNHECLVVEDAMSGIEAAKNAHMLVYGIFGAKDIPLADYRGERILDIVEIVHRQNS